jgi:hypothetical protein
MAKLSDARVDLVAEREGVWVDCPFIEGARFKLASTGTKEFEAALSKKYEPYRDLIRADAERDPSAPARFTAEMREGLVQELFSEIVIRDWDGLEADGGGSLKCSPAEALSAIKDPALRRLWMWIQAQANRWENFRAARKEKALGN